jgi:hypothetical protein
MTRPSRSLFVLPFALIAAGCADDAITLELLQTQPLMPPACLPTGAPGVGQSSGILDVGVVAGGAGTIPGYLITPVVKNNLMDPSQMPPAGASDLTVIGTDVQLLVTGTLSSALPSNQRSFFQPAYAGVVANGSTVAFSSEVVPVQVAVELNQALQDNEVQPMIVRFRVVALKTDSTSITSAWANFPLKICRWCLTGGKPPACPKNGVPKATVLTGACNVAQDLPVTCCISATNRQLCGPSVPTATM